MTQIYNAIFSHVKKKNWTYIQQKVALWGQLA